jgi:hypothetical protein
MSSKRPVFVQTSLGLGWRVEPEGLVLGLVTSAVARVVLSGAKPDAGLLTDATARALADFRQLWAGATVTVPSVTGFSGFELLDDVVVSTPWGSLRSASELERHFRSPIGRASAVISTPTRVRFVVLGDPPKPMGDCSCSRSCSQEARGFVLLLTRRGSRPWFRVIQGWVSFHVSRVRCPGSDRYST